MEKDNYAYFSQNLSQTQTGQTGNQGHSRNPASEHGGSHGSPQGGEMQPSDVFPTLFGHLGDHRELAFFDIHICDLPVILYDSKEGLHCYSSLKTMEQGQLFTTHAGHPPILRRSDEQPVTLDASVTSLVCFQWMAMLILLVVFGLVGRRYKKNPTKAPSGLQNLIESMVLFIRDEVVMPNIGAKRAANSLLPYFIGLFFFILVLNLFGLVPGGHTATGALAVTGALAITAYFVINITAIRVAGMGAWLKHLLGGAPVALCVIMIPIEIISMFVKPFALTIRLFANNTAGHVVLYSLVGLIFFFKLANGMAVGIAIAPVSVAFSIFMYMLELLVAFLQAYIFTILTAVFVGLAIGEHAHEPAHEH